MTLPNALLPGPRAGFPPGFTAVTRAVGTTASADAGLEIDFGLLKPSAGEVIAETHLSESAWVLLRGTAEVEFPGGRVAVRTPNDRAFAPRRNRAGCRRFVPMPENNLP